jgi:hypothetical protein
LWRFQDLYGPDVYTWPIADVGTRLNIRPLSEVERTWSGFAARRRTIMFRGRAVAIAARPESVRALKGHRKVRDLEEAIPAARLPHSIAVTELEIAELA